MHLKQLCQIVLYEKNSELEKHIETQLLQSKIIWYFNDKNKYFYKQHLATGKIKSVQRINQATVCLNN